MGATVVYALCAATSIACAALLGRSWWYGRSRLLLWSGLCFAMLAVNNILLFFDKVVVPDTDLSLARSLTAFAGVAVLVYGLVWDTR